MYIVIECPCMYIICLRFFFFIVKSIFSTGYVSLTRMICHRHFGNMGLRSYITKITYIT